MKKIIIIIVFILSGLSVFAQRGKAVQEGLEAAFKGGATVSTEAILRQVGRQTLPKPGFQLAEITNWSTKPLIHIMLPESPDIPPMKMIAAQAVNGEAFRQVVFPEPGLRELPDELNDHSPALYRGMPLNLKDIKNLLKKGMELERSSFRQLYFSADIDVALACANEENLLLPVVVKVRVTPELEMVRPPRLHEWDNYVFNGSIPAQHLDAVMVFLDANGTRGWHKVVLENDELLFKPVTSKLFSKEDLVIHRFNESSSVIPNVSLRSLWENFGNDGLW